MPEDIPYLMSLFQNQKGKEDYSRWLMPGKVVKAKGLPSRFDLSNDRTPWKSIVVHNNILIYNILCCKVTWSYNSIEYFWENIVHCHNRRGLWTSSRACVDSKL